MARHQEHRILHTVALLPHMANRGLQATPHQAPDLPKEACTEPPHPVSSTAGFRLLVRCRILINSNTQGRARRGAATPQTRLDK
jgi:hypothetical protein